MTLEERNALVEENQALVWSRVHRFSRGVPNMDYFQAGCEGFIKALNNYDPTRAALSSYAVPFIDGYIQMHIRKDHVIAPYRIQAHCANGRKTGFIYAETCDIDKMPDHTATESFEDEVISRVYVDELLSKLTPNRREVIQLYLDGYSYSDIARCLGISRQAVKGRMSKVRMNDVALRQERKMLYATNCT